MSESTSPKDPVRIVYHAGDRTFARLFKERSLEEVKDVVRRKLGLGSQTDVSLKQMGPGALLDLEDDDDFQAFRVLLRSAVSVDIQVTVAKSQDSTLPPPVTPLSQTTLSLGDVLNPRSSQQPQEHPSASKPATTSAGLPSEELAGKATSDQHPEVASTSDASTAKTLEPPKRKRKVSFDNVGVVASDEHTEYTPSKSIAIVPIASAKTTDSPTAPKPVGTERPPKKKIRKESKRKAKDVESTEAVGSPTTKASAAKPKTKKSATLKTGTGTETIKETKTSEPPAKKPKRLKKDESNALEKSSASVDQDVTDQLTGQPISPVNEVSIQSEDGTSKTLKSAKTNAPIGVCAAIPRTSASASVQSEVAAAILSRASKTITPEPPAKRKYVRRDTTKKSSAPSKALATKPATMLDGSTNAVPNTPAEQSAEEVDLPHGPSQQQTLGMNSPPCPICLEEPFHIRYCCPIVQKGPNAIRTRLEELKKTNAADQQSLIRQLEGLLHDPKVISQSPLKVAQTDGSPLENISLRLSTSFPETPNISSNSRLSEVTVESRGEGSSSESSDDMSEGDVERRESLALPRRESPDEQPLPFNDDLEAVVRGPRSKGRSILDFFDKLFGYEDDEDKAELDEDPDEEIGRSKRLSSRRITRSSDSESEEESRSPSPLSSVEGALKNVAHTVQGPNDSAEKSAEHREDNVVMQDPIDPPVSEGQDDDSEETHVESEDRMAVDEPIGEKGATIVTEEQPSSPVPRVSVLQPLDAPFGEPQELAQTKVDPAPNQDSNVPAAFEVLKEVEADPIEPADDLESPIVSRRSNIDPIEAPSEDVESTLKSATPSAPKSGVAKRIKARSGETPDGEADRPVLLEQLVLEATTEVTPIPPKGRSRKKVAETPAPQEPVRKSPRFNSLPPSTSTPVVLMYHKSKSGAQTGKITKTLTKPSEERLHARYKAHITPTSSLNQWETLAEPSSHSEQLDDPSPIIDELMSSSPLPDHNSVHGRSRKPASSSQAGSSQGKGRLFDLLSSQIPFPYSQNQTTPTLAASNGKEGEETTDSEHEVKASQKKAKLPVRYRPLSKLASDATLFSPSLPTPTNKSMTNGKAKKRVAEDTPSPSSDEEDEEDEDGKGSEHIPPRRRAGSALGPKKWKSLLSRI